MRIKFMKTNNSQFVEASTMKQSIFFILLLFLLVMIKPALATDKTTTDKITEIIIVSEAWEDATNEDGTGLYWDMFRAVYEPMGITVKKEFRTYSGSIEMVKRKKADAMVASFLDEVKEFIYPKQHFDTEDVVAMFKKDKVWTGAESMKGKNVGFINDYDYDEHFDFSMIVKEFGNREAILKSLEIDRIDFWLEAEEDVEFALKKSAIDEKRYRMEVVKEIKLYLGFVGTKRGKILADIFDRRFEKLLKSGKIQKLYDKWDWGKFK